MNKRGVLLLLFSLIFAVLMVGFCAAAEEAPEDNVNKAYKCLEDQIGERNLSLKEAVFSVLALGSKGNLVSRIESDKDVNSCWPKNACELKETAQTALAYQRIGKDTSSIKKWILAKNATASELKWFLEIDITSKLSANCIIKDGQRENKIKILEDARIQGSPGSCLSIDAQGFMLKINNNCLKNEFEISCDQDFITAVLYQKNIGETIFVLPETHSAASLGTTKEKVNGECFKKEASCDYEGSLWAAFALNKMGQDISKFIPYLLAFADDNAKYFPSTFLYILIGGEDQYNLIIQEQKQGKFWEITGSKDGRYYDTSLAMMALAGKGSTELDNAKSYLLGIQTDEGCWNSNNIRDTAFLLYSGWPKSVATGGAGAVADCEPTFSCENLFDCTEAGGIIESNYACPNPGESCCSVKVQQQTCAEKKGILCESDEECQGGRVESAADGTCCFGACVERAEDMCTPAGGICRTYCEDNEKESIETCSISGEVCCKEKSGGLWGWIIFFVILIGLTVLGIIYRNKLRLWWFKIAGKIFKKKTPALPAKPAVAAPQVRRAPLMPFTRPPFLQPRVPMRAPAKDKEIEETLRKLKEMSKK